MWLSMLPDLANGITAGLVAGQGRREGRGVS